MSRTDGKHTILFLSFLFQCWRRVHRLLNKSIEIQRIRIERHISPAELKQSRVRWANSARRPNQTGKKKYIQVGQWETINSLGKQ